ncbi:GAF domain-containing protein [Antarcticibacterium flavum]|uniref:histidine kinase n=1 Tax=Antarcticibacterium flavum TaxID=2058175 RepID=A0A5B7X019_9FLAO|nr:MULTISPECIES: ATP-binding protein [Antarcticibacterium]MCM4158722.1 histidine kinase [Antarcticibacterium sp. W02-3]QCY68575.1 GAF domain-containing protein [Antarcticibacterium flavum]
MSSTPGFYPDNVNLTNCDKEPIHIIGKAQAHGVILACNKDTLEITQCSKNAGRILGIETGDLLGKPLSILLPANELDRLYAGQEEKILMPELPFNDQTFLVIAHISNESIVLDIEPAGDNLSPVQFQEQLSKILNELNAAQTIDQINSRAVDLIKYLYGYDRVMLYRFDEEWNGEVVAEVKEEHLESWLGLHYPATDIPKPSRELFLKQGVRIIQDVNYTPSPLEPQLSPINEEPLDLSRSELRGVSPIHIEYLKNMKVGASLTAAIVLNGKLWGLIACHHYESRFINYHQRQSVKLLTQVYTNRLAMISSETYKKRSLEAREIREAIIYSLKTGNIAEALNTGTPGLIGVLESTGAAFYYNGQLSLTGTTPSPEETEELIKSFISKQENVYQTRNLVSQYAPAENFKEKASGVLSVEIGEEQGNYLLWFRKESAQTVDWGGKPQKSQKIEEGVSVLHPRKSFEKWTQKVSGIALPWKDYEIDAAIAFRDSLTHVILEQQQEEIKKLNERLQVVNKELEAFSYSVSHDLRAPLRGIRGFANILKEDYAGNLDEEGNRAIEIIIESATEMNSLIDDLLLYAKLGEEPVPQTPVDINKILTSLLSSFNLKDDYPNTTVHIEENLPEVYGNKRLITQLFSNLLNNALKYSGKKERPLVEIGTQKGPTGDTVFFIKDNGIGFDLKFREKIFKVFTRLSGKEYPGTGIGLAIARKVVLKHGGSLWVESSPGEGANFFFTLSNKN